MRHVRKVAWVAGDFSAPTSAPAPVPVLAPALTTTTASAPVKFNFAEK